MGKPSNYAFGIATVLSVFVAAHYIVLPDANPDAPPLASMQATGTAGTGSTGSQVSRLGAVEVHNAITDEAHIVIPPTSATPLMRPGLKRDPGEDHYEARGRYSPGELARQVANPENPQARRAPAVKGPKSDASST
jgi:hypothetical protein